MTLSISASEKKAIVAVLESGEYESPEAMASAIIQTFVEVREKRNQYALVTQWEGNALFAFGPYPTDDAATKDFMSGTLPLTHFGKTGIARLYSPRHAKDRLEESL